jgi:hypothetical protein
MRLHGTRGRYQQNCRCDLCVAAQKSYSSAYWQKPRPPKDLPLPKEELQPEPLLPEPHANSFTAWAERREEYWKDRVAEIMARTPTRLRVRRSSDQMKLAQGAES